MKDVIVKRFFLAIFTIQVHGVIEGATEINLLGITLL
jgi:hypothetical protein